MTEWIVDSGCTKHMTGEKELLVNPVKYGGNGVVVTAQDEEHGIAHVGDVRFSQGTTNKELVLKHVFHVPGMKKNLLSVSQLTSNGHYVLFGPNDVKIFKKFETSSQPVLLGRRTDCLYALSTETMMDGVADYAPVMLKVGEVKEIGSQGLEKKLIKEGEGWDTPDNGDEVQVHYTGTLLDGTKFGSSRDRGIPFKFTLGQEFTVQDGHLCPALSKAVKTMKKGEKVILTVKPQYGVGEKKNKASGNEGGVPAYATLLITLELVSWKTVTDVTKDGKVIKKILKEGEGYEHPNERAFVEVRFIGMLQDGTVFIKKGCDEGPTTPATNEEQVIEGLDRAVMTMKKGEVATVTIEPEYAFGATVSKQELAVVPPNSTVIFEIKLVSFHNEKEYWETIEAVGKKKEEGNSLFKAGKYLKASKHYEEAVKNIDYDATFGEEEKKQAKALKVSCNLNNAACELKLKDYKQAEKLCTKVWESDSNNVKGLYRRAQAYIHLADLDLAELDIKKALEIDPDNRDVKLEYKVLKEKMKEYKKKDAKLYGNMFANVAAVDSKKTAAPVAIDNKV